MSGEICRELRHSLLAGEPVGLVTVTETNATAPLDEAVPAKKTRKRRATSAPSSTDEANRPQATSSSPSHDVAPEPVEGDETAAEGHGDGATTVRQINAAESEPVDLVNLAGRSVARRLLKPVLIAAAIAVVVGAKRRRRNR